MSEGLWYYNKCFSCTIRRRVFVFLTYSWKKREAKFCINDLNFFSDIYSDLLFYLAKIYRRKFTCLAMSCLSVDSKMSKDYLVLVMVKFYEFGKQLRRVCPPRPALRVILLRVPRTVLLQ